MGGVTTGKGRAARALGVIMLQTRFPRPVGDIGNPRSFDFPVRYAVVEGASPAHVVLGRGDGLLQPFIDAARSLQEQGCRAITTSCGFLSLFQDRIAGALEVPFVASSLAQIPEVNQGLGPGKRAGVVTISAAALTAEHLRAAGADPGTPVAGVAANGEFARAILGDMPEFDAAALCAEVVEAGTRLAGLDDGIGAIVLECTNMPPYAGALREATGLPVYDALSLARSLMRESSC